MFAGNQTAARLLIERYHRPLFGMLSRLCRNPADAEELFQETFARALAASGRFDPNRRFKPWLFAIALNLARDRANRMAHPASPEIRASDKLPEPSRPSFEKAWVLRSDLLRAMDALPAHHREVLLLKYFEGMQEGEIADSVGVARGTVKSRLHHALRKLRDILREGETP